MAQKRAARKLAVGLKAMPLSGDHNIFLECPLEIVIVLPIASIYVCNIFKQRHKAFQMLNKGIK